MLANALEWEIDFFKDLQPGDSYTLVVEKSFADHNLLVMVKF